MNSLQILGAANGLGKMSLAWLMVLSGTSCLAFGGGDQPAASIPSGTLIPVCLSAWQNMCGLLDEQGRWAAQFVDKRLQYLDEGVWAVLDNGWTEQLLDAKGQPLARMRSNARVEAFSEGMAALERSGSSYLNARGEVVLAGPYEVASPFREGLARVGRFVRDPDGGHYSLGFIDPQGRQVIAEQYTDAQDFHHGLAVVQLADERIGAIDQRNQMRVPATERSALQVVAPDRLISQESNGQASLIDGRGQILFRAQSIRQAAEGRAFFSNNDSHLGLLDLRTGKPVVKAFAGPRGSSWYAPAGFFEGRAWIHQTREVEDRNGQEPRWQKRILLIDAQGQVLHEGQGWQWAGRFVNGTASVFLGDDGGGNLLVDRAGKTIDMNLGPQAAQVREASVSAWPEREGAVRVFPMRALSQEDKVGDESAWVDSRGKLLFVRSRLSCGIEQLRSADGRPLWPVDDVAERCVLEAERQQRPPEARYLSAADQGRLQQLREDDDKGLDLGPEAVLRQAAGLPVRFFPLRRDGQYLSDRPGWVEGPAAIVLASPRMSDQLTLHLPAGYRYLPPEAIAAMRKEEAAAGSAPEQDGDLTWGVIAPGKDPQWAARVQLVRTGRLRRPSDQELEPEGLAETIRRYDYGSPLNAGAEGVQSTSVTWLVPPQWGDGHQRLSWGLSKFVLGQPKGNSASGITLVQAVQGNESLVLNVPVYRMRPAQATAVMQQLALLADAAALQPGDGSTPEEVVSERDAASLITGSKPVELAEFQGRVVQALERDREQRDERTRSLIWRALATITPLLLMLWAGLSRRRQARGA
jgi:uncharacterized membrane-anchored protein